MRFYLAALLSVFLLTACGEEKREPFSIGIDGNKDVTITYGSTEGFQLNAVLSKSDIKNAKSVRLCGENLSSMNRLTIQKPACCGGGGKMNIRPGDAGLKIEGPCWNVERLPFPLSPKTTFTFSKD